jgi:nitrous oxide reductase accessory protein NosL
MLISTEKGAAEIVPLDGETRFYDDIACLASDWRSHGAPAHAFVRAAGGAWIDAGSAAFARPSDVRTAMGSGLVAFSTAADARAASGQDAVLSFDDVVRGMGAGR